MAHTIRSGKRKVQQHNKRFSVSPYYRVYHHLDSWRVDRGYSSIPQEFDEVIITCPGSTNEDSEISWIEVYDAVLREEDGVGYLESEKE